MTDSPSYLSDRTVADVDPDVDAAIRAEVRRQETTLEMIASENFVSEAVLEAMGSPLTNKYAEGYPGRRYYGGCDNVDIAESLAIERAKELFGCDHANVQPHSGSQANMAVYFAVLEPGDTIMGMDLSCGGHLTHGHPANFSGRMYNVVPYGVTKDDHLIDFTQVEELAQKHKPKLIVTGASAYPRHIDCSTFREIADDVGALLMSDIAHTAGLVATGLHPNPVPHCHFVTTTTHKTLRGPRGGMVMCTDAQKKVLNSRVFPGIQGGPLMHVIAAKAVAFKEALEPAFTEYCTQIIANAKALAKVLSDGGLALVSGGTDNHLLLVDMRPKNLTGKVAEDTLDRAGITVNKNAIPFDPEKPTVTSGIRIGTPALTTRGMKETEMEQIGAWILDALTNKDLETKLNAIRGEVAQLCERFPLYPARPH